MPAMYAHDTFGKQVASKLPLSVKKPILQFPQMFRVGLQGPDILFFYNPFHKHAVGDMGHLLHQKNAEEIFTAACKVWKAEGEKVGQLSYLMGFLCHYLLDSACHPYINEQADQTGQGHIAIETEFDRMLMLLDGKDPVSFPVGYMMPTDSGLAEQIAPLFPGVSVKELDKSIHAMRRYKNLLVMPYAPIRELAKKGMRVVGQYNSVTQHMIEPNPNRSCRLVCEHLWELYQRQIPQAVQQQTLFVDAMKSGGPFDERLCRNFG